MAEKALAIRPKAELVKVGKRSISTHGWRVDLLEVHLKAHLGYPPTRGWCDVACLARTFWHRNSLQNQKQVRRRIGRAFGDLLQRGHFLVIEYAQGRGTHGEILACKFYTKSNEAERQRAESQVDKMQKRREISQTTLETALAFLATRT